MSNIRDLVDLLQEKYTDKDTFFASLEEHAFFNEQKVFPPQRKNHSMASVQESPKKPEAAALSQPTIGLQPPPSSTKASYIDTLRSVVQKAAPHMVLKETVPDDSKAKKVGSLWQDHLQDVHVALVSFGTQGRDLAFLQNVAAAVTSLLAPAQIIDGFKMESEQKWELFFAKTPLKLLLAPPLVTWKGKALAQYFRENPVAQTATLGPAPVLLLRPLREYIQTPQLKRDLWKSLVSHLSP